MPRISIPDIRSWDTVATHYDDGESGSFRLNHFRRRVGRYQSFATKYAYTVLRPITLTRLIEFRDGEWQYWMTDNPSDVFSMESYGRQASGKVLVGGLGLALLPNELAKNDSVESVTIVEKNEDVINLSGRYVPEGMEVVHSDLWDFIEKDNTDWDYIIIDVWATDDKDEYNRLLKEEVTPKWQMLKKKYPNTSITIHGYPIISDLDIYEKP